MNTSELFIRPTYKAWGIYRMIGVNRAKIIFEGAKEECYEHLQKLKKDEFKRKCNEHLYV